ncbi:MAG: LexA repressor [uncultured bacterium]|nr:MAG: LexA repressor [uncultured bacterium]
MKLTSKQKNILELIRDAVENRKENPTSYRLHKHLSSMGVEESLKSFMQVIEALEKKDLIKRDKEKRIYLVENDSYANMRNVISLPLYGLASCGEALVYADGGVADDFLQISKSLFYKSDPKKLFAVKALGDSMNRNGINDGDYVVFEKVEGTEDFNGKAVVAVINGMATIKRFKKLGNGIIGLFPESTNNSHHPIYISETDSIMIAGIFRKVLPVAFVSI